MNALLWFVPVAMLALLGGWWWLDQGKTPLSAQPVAQVAHKPQSLRDRVHEARLRDGVLELKWKDLIPSHFKMKTVLTADDLQALNDDDPRAQKLLETYLAEGRSAPVVGLLDQRKVRIAGHIVPLDQDGEGIRESDKVTEPIKVWYGGAWISGRMSLERLDHEIGSAGYAVDADDVSPYAG